LQGVVVLAVGLLTLIAFLRIHTMVTGQDPRTFIVLGRQIATQHFSPAVIRETAGFVIPGYPLLLAGMISLFGLNAVFGLNSILFVVLLLLLHRLLARLMKNERQAGFMALFCLAGLFAGFERNAHFLLLAFRNTPMYVFSTASLLALLAASERKQRSAFSWGALGASLLLLLGTGIRETVVFMAAPMLLLILIRRPRPDEPSRTTLALCFLLPLLLVGCAAGVVLSQRPDLLLNSQSRQLLRILPAMVRSFSGPLSPFRDAVGFLWDELHGWGLALWVMGIWYARKQPFFLCGFLLPALLYFGFDGAIKAHRRFFLTTLFFMLPLCSLSVAVWVEEAAKRLGRRFRFAGDILYVLAWAGAAAWGLHAALSLQPWGTRVSLEEVARMQDVLARQALKEGNVVLVDGRSRHLIDALTVFTDVSPVNAADPDQVLVQHPPRLFIEPLNKGSIHPIEQSPPALPAIAQQGRLEKTGIRFVLGAGEFELARILPWTNNRIRETLPPPPDDPAILRLHAPILQGPPYNRTAVRVQLDGRDILPELTVGANFAVVSTSSGGPRSPLLQIESDAPLPNTFHPAWLAWNTSIDMKFGAGRTPSFDAYLSPEFFRFPSPNPYAREWRAAGRIRLPVLYPSNTYLIVIPGVSSVHHEPDVPVRLTLSSRGRTLAQTHVPASARLQAPLLHIGELEAPPVEEVEIRMERERPYRHPIPDERGLNDLLHNFMLYPIRLGAPVLIRLGVSSDTPDAAEGFWARERTPEGSGRWTKERAVVFLPLQPGRDHRVSLRYQVNRPEHVPGPDPILRWNGAPLPFSSDVPDSLTAWIPAEQISSVSNVLEILTLPWRPSEALGSRDPRQLGLFLQQVEAEPVSPTLHDSPEANP
jgi:hypothetical protein